MFTTLNELSLGMKRLFIALLFSLTLTSCFDIIEEVNLNENGSGQFKLTMDLSKSEAWLDALFTLETYRGKKVPSIKQIESKLDSVKLTVASTEGISNVQLEKDFESYIFTWSFDFSNAQQLNSALDKVMDTYGTKIHDDVKSHDYYTYDGKSLIRNNAVDFQSIMGKMSNDTLLLKTSNYVHILRSSKQIKTATNIHSKVSKSGKAVLTRANLMEAFKTKSLESIQIDFK